MPRNMLIHTADALSAQVERLREIASFNSSHAVQIMPTPSYLSALLYEGNANDDVLKDIILVYKAVCFI